MKKNDNLDSKLQILTPNQEIFKKSRKLSFFFMFFSFSLPVAPEIQESHEKQWKTIKNKEKNEKKMKLQMKKHEVANEKNEVWWQKVMNKNEKNEDKMKKKR